MVRARLSAAAGCDFCAWSPQPEPSADGKRICVSGGAGYIGSHTCLEMLGEGHEPTVMDNMHNASPEGLKRVQKLSGKEITFHEVNLLDVPGMEAIFSATK